MYFVPLCMRCKTIFVKRDMGDWSISRREIWKPVLKLDFMAHGINGVAFRIWTQEYRLQRRTGGFLLLPFWPKLTQKTSRIRCVQIRIRWMGPSENLLDLQSSLFKKFRVNCNFLISRVTHVWLHFTTTYIKPHAPYCNLGRRGVPLN